MFSFQNIAPKLLIGEILDSQVFETASGPKLVSHGIHYTRVQIQVREDPTKMRVLGLKILKKVIESVGFGAKQ
jgi:hypothetical protein